MGKVLILVGVVIAGIGILVSLGVPLGRLPGDFVYKRGGATVYFPVASCVVISVVLSLVIGFLRR